MGSTQALHVTYAPTVPCPPLYEPEAEATESATESAACSARAMGWRSAAWPPARQCQEPDSQEHPGPRISLEPPPDLDAPSSEPPARSSGRAATFGGEQALWMAGLGLLDSAADTLERLCLEQPHHEPARTILLQLCIALGRNDRVGVHTAWLLRGHLRSGRSSDACKTYEGVRAALPSLTLPEVVLVAALTAADETSARSVVFDSTNVLVARYPESPQTPRALLVCAKHQLMSGAPEPATQTLRYLVSTYPKDVAAGPARRKLAELGRLETSGS